MNEKRQKQHQKSLPEIIFTQNRKQVQNLLLCKPQAFGRKALKKWECRALKKELRLPKFRDRCSTKVLLPYG
jgi:hypothetical protein